MKARWERKTIGDVCDVVNGGTPKTGVAEYWNGPNQWVTPAEMGKRASPYIAQTDRTITDDGVRDSSARLLPPQSVILSSRAPIGYLVINTEPMATNQGCKGLVPKKELDTKYLYYFLSSITQLLNDLGSGATFKELSGGKLKEIQIPISPLKEQKRIVTLLDEAFAHIATAKANAEKNLQNARALFESHLQSVFFRGGTGWKTTTLGKEIDLLLGFAFKSTLYTEADDSINLLRGDNIMQGAIRWDDAKRWPLSNLEPYEKYQLAEDDIVLAMDRPWVKAGLKRAIVSTQDLPCLLVQRTACIRTRENMNARFLLSLISSHAFTEHILSVQTGSGVPHISGQQIKDFEFLCPPIVIQRELAAKLDALSTETQRLESLYQQKISALEALKKSLLHQAFSGAL